MNDAKAMIEKGASAVMRMWNDSGSYTAVDYSRAVLGAAGVLPNGRGTTLGERFIQSLNDAASPEDIDRIAAAVKEAAAKVAGTLHTGYGDSREHLAAAIRAMDLDGIEVPHAH